MDDSLPLGKPMSCQIYIKGRLPASWSDWFGGLSVHDDPAGEALISGWLPDQAVLFGVLERLRDLGIQLLALNCTVAVLTPSPDTTVSSSYDPEHPIKIAWRFIAQEPHP